MSETVPEVEAAAATDAATVSVTETETGATTDTESVTDTGPDTDSATATFMETVAVAVYATLHPCRKRAVLPLHAINSRSRE